MTQLQPKEILEKLQEAIQEIAETMMFVEIVPGESLYCQAELPVDFSAVIGFGQAFRGSLRLAAPTKTALKLASALLMEEREEMDSEMSDAFGELANMLAGGLQTRVEGDLGPISMSPPILISGKNHRSFSDHSFFCVSQTFELEGLAFIAEVFYLEESLQKKPVPRKNSEKLGFGLSLSMPGDTESYITEDEGDTANESSQPSPITDSTRDMARELIRTLLPQIASKVVQEEIDRIKNVDSDKEKESSLDFDQMVRDVFAPQVEIIARELSRQQVAKTLPNVAERMVLEEIQKLQA